VHKVHKFHNNTVPIGKEHIDEVPRSEDKNHALQTGEKKFREWRLLSGDIFILFHRHINRCRHAVALELNE